MAWCIWRLRTPLAERVGAATTALVFAAVMAALALAARASPVVWHEGRAPA